MCIRDSIKRLHFLDNLFMGRVVTLMSNPLNVDKMVRFADVVVGAIQVPGARSPILISRELVRSMKRRSIIMDVAVTTGGCVETTRPTTHTAPTYIEEGVIHYCVPNMTGIVARTATHAFNNAAWPYIHSIASDGLDAAIEKSPSLTRGVNTRAGKILLPGLAAAYNMTS